MNIRNEDFSIHMNTVHVGIVDRGLNDLSNRAPNTSAVFYPLSGNWNDVISHATKNQIIKCEYCGSSNCFEYKEFNCVKCGAPLKIAKPF